MAKDTSEQLKKKAMIEALETTLGVVTKACKIAKIGRSTHYTWMNDDAEYKAKVEEMSDVALDFVESQLFNQIKNGDNAPTIFYLKTKGKKRGYYEKAPDQSDNITMIASSLNKLTPDQLQALDDIKGTIGGE